MFTSLLRTALVASVLVPLSAPLSAKAQSFESLTIEQKGFAIGVLAGVICHENRKANPYNVDFRAVARTVVAGKGINGSVLRHPNVRKAAQVVQPYLNDNCDVVDKAALGAAALPYLM